MVRYLIVSPSAAGKSTVVMTAAKNPRLRHVVLDGDDLISAQNYWPGRGMFPNTPEGWAAARMKISEYWHSFRPGGRVVLFNGDAKRWHQLVAAVVLPSMPIHLRNMHVRRTTTSRVYGVSREQVLENREFLYRLAYDYDLPLYDRFNDAIADVLTQNIGTQSDLPALARALL